MRLIGPVKVDVLFLIRKKIKKGEGVFFITEKITLDKKQDIYLYRPCIGIVLMLNLRFGSKSRDDKLFTAFVK